MKTGLSTTFTFCFLAVFLAVWFAILIPWDRLPDPDAFYHAAMAQMTWQNGPVINFPWLDLTVLGQHFADQHYLLHVLQGPFVQFWGLSNGSRISSWLFAVVCLLGMALVFYKLKLKSFWLWTLALALTNPFATRLVLGKASPLAILFWLTVLYAVINFLIDTPDLRKPCKHSCHPCGGRMPEPAPYYDTGTGIHPILLDSCPRRNDKEKSGNDEGGSIHTKVKGRKGIELILIFVVSLLFALTHGGWIILPGSILLLMAGEVLYQRALCGASWFQLIKRTPWACLLASLVGIAVGLLLHPGRGELLTMLWLQVVKIGLMTPRYLMPMGQEWNASNPLTVLAMTSVFGVVLLLLIPGLIFARQQGILKSPLLRGEAKGESTMSSAIHLSVVWSFLVAALLALTIKSARFAEYWQPALAIWTAALAQLVDWKKLFKWLSLGDGRLSRHLMPIVICVSLAAVIFNSAWGSYNALRNEGKFMDDRYLGATQAISRAAKPGDRVYHSQWDEFPMLFSRDRRLRYIAGLDPNFFYEASSTLALDYFNLSLHGASSTKEQAWSVIHDRLQAKFVMVDTLRWPDLAKLIDSDPRYEKIGQGQGGAAYRITQNK